MGILSAVKQYSALDYLATGGAFLGISLPNFFLGMALIYIFALKLNLLPTGGLFTLGGDRSAGDMLLHLILPTVVLGAHIAGNLSVMFAPAFWKSWDRIYYDESVRDYYPYDPEKAKELLAQIGWDGSRTLELLVPTGQGLEDAANIIVENLRSIGITVNQVSVDMPTSIQLQISGEYELALGNLAFQYEPDQSNFLKTGASNNFPFYSNARLDELFDKGAQAVDPEERKVYYNEYQHIYMTDLPHIPLYFDYRMMAVSKRVTKGKLADIGMLIDGHEWDVE